MTSTKLVMCGRHFLKKKKLHLQIAWNQFKAVHEMKLMPT